MAGKAKAHVVISGRVQGVFFRKETQRAAKRQGVAGWVRNKRDRTVEAVFEGDEADVSAMIDWCWKGSPHSDVRDVAVSWEMYAGEFGSFEITY